MSLTSLMSFLSSRWVSAAEFTTKATTTNIPYELDAHRTGLCSWASSSLTTAFVSLVCAWLAVEAEMATRAPSFVVCSAVVVRHTFFTTALCACVDFASAQVPLCTMWLLLPLIGFSLEGLVPPRVWRTLIACFIPMSSTALSGRGATPAFPALLWVTSAVAH
ncbi:hypothetical protein conserved [Leishmania donovani]|uniref:Uncharacterized protein n=4 Tax=Leishmania donovani species complex TaxID=38574 RepID=A4IC15_LEIIN|nr:hypothetical protein, unknown function [Leishmania infantum JPCM5]XP_003865061.1 hypothetical protein, unknown function [Leishmania donovani]CAC9547190.1 hypothetical_protein_-_conserved [Leishmania infantum]AYU83283.1 hypothetical protein LdCL_350053400 [Leishmania donovani]CAJ1993295.1 hypothetical protein conserved [Leishmania donovani]CAM72389.1 hypothetical protein, unknown function [Leishmania infantum JPCM5]CBZ38382.1 hypothetical protein, unknown function [Leishmania donovani]|eukprot:XP_001469284.1 hypothetical protein, unknown function [Leishmania infantum JPCM5]